MKDGKKISYAVSKINELRREVPGWKSAEEVRRWRERSR
jgi:hypothetical protein